ncbi:MAG TPA: acetolactate synthase large subunit [Allosphingosinicella sp.]|nr:acetolactate synthase large subunit [Allosphingosinicella sp.]
MSLNTGAQAIVQTLLHHGLDTWFTNPGTSEMHLVEALAQTEGTRSILTLFEGVATGAADGYGRMLGKPAATLLHLGPGLANGLANLHNARRAHSGIVNVVGDQTVAHDRFDPPLTSDIEAIAGSVSAWVRKIETPERAAQDAAEALASAGGDPGRISTLIVPADVAWSNAPAEASPASAAPAATAPDPTGIAEQLQDGEQIAIIAGGTALREESLRHLEGIAARLGATLYCETFFARMERGGGRVEPKRLPYFPEQAAAELSTFDTLLLVGARDPVAFFAYRSIGGTLAREGARRIVLAAPDQNCDAPVAALAGRLGVATDQGGSPSMPEAPTSGPLDAMTVGLAVAALLPEDCIVIDEANTSGGPAYALCASAPRHDWLTLTGGAIGQGLPLATGAAVACPGRKVISLQADGSAMYTLQALWTQAREGLDIVTVIFSNRRYAILAAEYERLTGTSPVGSAAMEQFTLDRPELDFVRLAEGMGVAAVRATDIAMFTRQFRDALRSGTGPRLIDVQLD